MGNAAGQKSPGIFALQLDPGLGRGPGVATGSRSSALGTPSAVTRQSLASLAPGRLSRICRSARRSYSPRCLLCLLDGCSSGHSPLYSLRARSVVDRLMQCFRASAAGAMPSVLAATQAASYLRSESTQVARWEEAMPEVDLRLRDKPSDCLRGWQRSTVLSSEVGGRWGTGALALVRDFVRLRRLRAPPALRHAAATAWARRWWTQLSVAVQRATALSAAGRAWPAASRAAADAPAFELVLDLADAAGPSMLPFRA